MKDNLSPAQIEQVSRTVRDWLYTSGACQQWSECKEFWIRDVVRLQEDLQKKGFVINTEPNKQYAPK
jgi:hypothetical protein